MKSPGHATAGRWRRRVGALGAAAVVAALTSVIAPATPATALDNGVGRTPPMGWNDWNTFGCNVSETLIKQTADAIVSRGLAALGYEYVVVDDCWFDPNRDSQGNLRANSSRFPSGMKALGDYLHARGLKFGIYQVPGTKTCAQGTGAYPGATGSQGHEYQDARTFASWGVDYLKYDWCSGWGTVSDQIAAFAKMRDALASTGRPILFSINPNSFHCCPGPSRNWGDVSNIWRTTEDITTRWDTGNYNAYPMGIRNIVNINAPLHAYAGPGHFNDPDMLEVGVGSNLTDTQQRSHFAMWAVMAAPLIMGNDVRNMSSSTLAILSNKALIDINQDPLGLQGVQIQNDGTRRVLAKRLSNGDVAVALFNGGSSQTTISTSAAAAGLSGSSFRLYDVWTGQTTTTSGTISASVPAYGTVVYRVSGGTQVTTTTSGSGSAGELVTPSGKCLDAGGTAIGTTVRIATCNGSAQQRWEYVSGGAWRNGNGSCLDANERGTTNGTPVIIWTCNGQDNQTWSWSGQTIVGLQSGRCLDVPNGSSTDGTTLQLYDCWGGDPQKWTLRTGGGTTTTTTTTSSPPTTTTTTTTTTTVPTTTTTTVPTTTTTTSGGSGGCSATYTAIGAWPGGFQGEVTVRNTGSSALSSWTVKLELASGQSIVSLWNGVASANSGSVTVTNAPHNGAVPPSGSTSFGFVGGGSGSPVPTVSC